MLFTAMALAGPTYYKRCAITGLTRGKEYTLTAERMAHACFTCQ